LIDSPRTLRAINEGLVNGGYIVKDFNNTAHAQKIILVASGSEVGLALQTASLLEKTA
jgi:transketolase